MEYDVLIVGARVAGASLALLLGERGHRVLLVDRDQFPSDTLSTHFMSPFAVDLLRRLAVLDDVEAVGFRRVVRLRTCVDDCMFDGPMGSPGAYALAPRRDSLDSILIRHARERGGVDFQARTTAEGLIECDGRVAGAILRGEDGQRREVSARVVVGADGKYSKVAEWVKAERYAAVDALRPAYYGYYHGFAPLPEPTLEFYFVRNRIGFVFPMRPDEDCLALELQPEEFEMFRADPQAVFEDQYGSLPGMRARMAGAKLEGKLLGTRGIDNYLRKPYGPGWALTGDAAYLKDPSTGTGIGDALAQAFPLADALDAALGGADWEASMSAFHRERDKTVLPTYQWTIAATRRQDAAPESLAALRAALINPHFTRELMYWLPSALLGGRPPHLQPTMDQMASVFGVKPAAVAASTPAPTHD